MRPRRRRPQYDIKPRSGGRKWRKRLTLESSTSRVLPKDERGVAKAHGLGCHDLVRLLVLQHAILVNAAFVGERVGAHCVGGERDDKAARIQ